MARWIRDSIRLARHCGLTVEFVTEDTARSDPGSLKALYGVAIEEGVGRVWIADTVGEATPNSAGNITRYFMREIIGPRTIGLYWHGHDDRGLGVANSLAALEAGGDRIQAIALGIGERVGNAPMEPVVINLVLACVASYRRAVPSPTSRNRESGTTEGSRPNETGAPG